MRAHFLHVDLQLCCCHRGAAKYHYILLRDGAMEVKLPVIKASFQDETNRLKIRRDLTLFKQI